MIKRGVWVKSSRSNGTGGSNCVEVKVSEHSGAIRVRDSKNNARLEELCFTPAEWRAFIAGVKAGEFDIEE